MARGGSPSPKRQRTVTSLDLLKMIATLPKDFATDPIGVLILQFIGCQAIATSCRAALEWLTTRGRRFVFHLDDHGRGVSGPFAPLDRLAPGHVEAVTLGRYGRGSVDEHVEVLLSCINAKVVRCIYAKLAGVHKRLAEAQPAFKWRSLRLHQCRLQAGDVAELIASAEALEQLEISGEALTGLAAELTARPRAAPTRHLRTLELTDCRFTVDDVVALLQMRGTHLESLHIQASCLTGVRCRFPDLPKLRRLRLLDCGLSRADATELLCRCPALEELELCGNNLSAGGDSDDSSEEGEDEAACWPALRSLRRADLRACGLGVGDEEALRWSLVGQPSLELLLVAAESAGPRHVVFDSSSDEE